LFLSGIIKTVATRCQILRLKCTKIDFAPPGSLAGFKGPTSKGREKGGRGWKGKEGEGKKGREKESKNVLPHVTQAVAAYGQCAT